MNDYEKYTKEELRKICDERQIEFTSKETKADLITKLYENDWVNGETFEDDKKEKEDGDSTEEKDVYAGIIENIEEDSDSSDNENSNSEPKDTSKETFVGRKKANMALSGELKKVRLRKAKKIYYDSNDSVLTIDNNDEKVLTEAERGERELLLSKSDPNAILSGKVTTITAPSKIMLDNEYRVIASATVIYKGKKINIMTPMFFTNWERIQNEDVLKAMQMRIGSEIDFRVLDKAEDGDTYKYYGSRTDAMAIKRKNYWYGKKRSKGEVIYRINEGDIVEARVVAVSSKSVYVEVFGVETGIFVDELAYEYVPDARDKYTTGDRCKVKIMKIERDLSAESLKGVDGNPPTYAVKISASIKATKQDPREIFFDDYEINDTCLGVVTKYKDSPKTPMYFVNVAGEIDVLCWMKSGVTLLPEEGDTVSIKIARKYPEKKMITGTITHVMGRR